jgi:hypothetical protein
MPDPDYKALCKELADALAEQDRCWMLINDARAALAQPEPARQPTFSELLMPPPRTALVQPEPVAPMDEELLGLYGIATPCYHVEQYRRELDFARAVLARWGTPANTINYDHD